MATEISTRTQAALEKLPPKARELVAGALNRSNRQAAVNAAKAAKAPMMMIAGGAAAGAIDAAAQSMGMSWSLEVGGVQITPGLAVGTVAFLAGVVEGDETLASFGSASVSILAYQATNRAVAGFLA